VRSPDDVFYRSELGEETGRRVRDLPITMDKLL